jgi:hypothetical protein
MISGRFAWWCRARETGDVANTPIMTFNRATSGILDNQLMFELRWRSIWDLGHKACTRLVFQQFSW